MRCTVCFGEMKQGEDGLECVSCGVALDAVVEEGVEISVEGSDQSRVRRILLASGVVATTLLILFFTVLLPGFAKDSDKRGFVTVITSLDEFAINDSSRLIGAAIQRRDTSDTVNLVKALGCQRTPEDRETDIRWVTMTGAWVDPFRPNLPENWKLHSACPTRSDGSFLLTYLNEGIAISEVNPSGDLLWSQFLFANSDNAVATLMSVTEDEILILAPNTDASGIRIAAFDLLGAEKWSETVFAAPGSRPYMARNGLEDYLFAWMETGQLSRLAVMSAEGVLVQNTQIPGTEAELIGIAGDDVGQTIMVFADKGVSAQLVSANGASNPRWNIDVDARPIGAALHDSIFLVFGISENSFLIWGVNELGSTSSPVQLDISSDLVAGEIHQLNEFEAVASLASGAGVVTDITLDLRRISNSLIFDEPDESTTVFNAINRDLEENTLINQPDLVSLAPQSEPAVDAGITEEVDVRPEVTQVTARERGAQSDPIDDSEVTNSSETITEPAAPAARALSLAENEVRCTFNCQTNEEPIAEYVLSQIVEKTSEESVQDVLLRLNSVHENLCTLSGGEPVEDYTRVCEN